LFFSPSPPAQSTREDRKTHNNQYRDAINDSAAANHSLDLRLAWVGVRHSRATPSQKNAHLWCSLRAAKAAAAA